MNSQLRRWLFGSGLSAALSILPACGNLGPTGGHRAPLPSGTITSISPSSVTAGGPPFTLTINGSGFYSQENIIWNGGTQIPTLGVSSTQLTAVIDPGLIANPGNISIAITLTGMGVSPSNAVPLAVNPHTSTACALFGLYHFLFTGFDSNGPVTAVGAFGVDANGNVDGAEDFVDAPNIFGPPVNQSGEGQNMFTGGQCTNSATPNQGSLTFSFIGFDLIPETFTYTFVLEQGGGGTPRGSWNPTTWPTSRE